MGAAGTPVSPAFPTACVCGVAVAGHGVGRYVVCNDGGVVLRRQHGDEAGDEIDDGWRVLHENRRLPHSKASALVQLSARIDGAEA